MIARFKEEYDTILIDTPPTLQMPDARVIGRLSDAVLLVLRANHTTRAAALAARQRFAEDQIRVPGTPPKYAKAWVCPSRKASIVSAGNAITKQSSDCGRSTAR
jgi:MinD-like ATPase involved in chromosome partitioning or flagellar assembly